MTKKLDNVKALYLEGIQEGRARESVEKYTGDRYTQHSTGVRDGVEGFVEFFETFLERNPVRDIRVVRSIEDGPFVFVHASQSLNNGESRWITMDMFDTDENDKIVEHWDVITEWVAETPSGHSPIDGPTEVTDQDRTDANKATATAFIDDVLVNGRDELRDDYLSAETYIERSSQAPDAAPMAYKYVHGVLGQGNFVVSYCLAQIGDEDMAVFDLFRLENGLIAEHWDTMEPLPRGENLVNQGKF